MRWPHGHDLGIAAVPEQAEQGLLRVLKRNRIAPGRCGHLVLFFARLAMLPDEHALMPIHTIHNRWGDAGIEQQQRARASSQQGGLVGYLKMMEQAKNTDELVVTLRNGEVPHITLYPADGANPLGHDRIRFGIGVRPAYGTRVNRRHLPAKVRSRKREVTLAGP